MDEENIINELLKENRNDFDDATALGVISILDDLSNKGLINDKILSDSSNESNQTLTDVAYNNNNNNNPDQSTDTNTKTSIDSTISHQATIIQKVKEIDLNKERDTTQHNSLEHTDENDENVQIVIDKETNKSSNQNNNLPIQITRPCQFAVSRIKSIMKLDPDLSLASKESVFLITKATEYFVDFLSKEAYKFTSQGSRKTLQKKDIDQAVNLVDSLCFLDAALD